MVCSPERFCAGIFSAELVCGRLSGKNPGSNFGWRSLFLELYGSGAALKLQTEKFLHLLTDVFLVSLALVLAGALPEYQFLALVCANSKQLHLVDAHNLKLRPP